MHVYLNSAGHCWEIMNGEICVTGMQQEASDYGDFDISVVCTSAQQDLSDALKHVKMHNNFHRGGESSSDSTTHKSSQHIQYCI